MNTTARIPAEIETLVHELFAGWGLGAPPSDLKISVSTRLTKSLARCLPERPEIRIAAFLLDGPSPLLREVLCHELAHLITHMRFGKSVKPHGPEWKALVRKAGFEPRVQIPTGRPRSVSATTAARSRKVPSTLWAHRCPVCQMTRIAHRSVPQWRCESCVKDGLDGRLVIERVDDRLKGNSPVQRVCGSTGTVGDTAGVADG